MDETEILQAIDEARRATREDFEVPWIAPEEAARISGLPKVHARMLRRVLRGLHQWFVGRKDEERGGLEAGGTPACSRCPHAKAARGVRESSGGSSATESRDTMDLLTWGKTYLPEHFLKPPSAMHQWRIRRLGPLLAGRRLRFKTECPSTKLLVSQFQEFPLAEHDDGPDALEMAMRLAEEMVAGTFDDGLGNRLPVGRD